jgi:hypothetical protein
MISNYVFQKELMQVRIEIKPRKTMLENILFARVPSAPASSRSGSSLYMRLFYFLTISLTAQMQLLFSDTIMKKSKRILIVTDSISMPRPGLPYEEIWVHHIKKRFPDLDFIDKSARGSTSTRLVTEGGAGADLLENYDPWAVILQQGYAECAPRLFKKHGAEYYIMNKIMGPALRKKYISFIKKHRGRKPDLTDVSADQFEKNINNYFERAENIGTKIILILMHPANSIFKQKSPFIQHNSDFYNSIYKKAAEEHDNIIVIDPFKSKNMDQFSIDEVHYNLNGHKILFDAITRTMVKLLNNKT